MKPALTFCGWLAILCLASRCTPPPTTASEAENPADRAWREEVPQILARIRPPQIPARTFAAEDFGNLQADALRAIQAAIDTCHARGGGRVNVPTGQYLVRGPLELRSYVRLHVPEGCTLRFSTNPDDYLPVVKVRWEGTVCYNYSPFVRAHGQQHIALTGQGTLDGQADQFWHAWKQKQKADQQQLRQMGHEGVPDSLRVFGAGHYLRPSLIEFFECTNILLEDLTVRGSPFWTVHPVFSRHITIRGLTIRKGTTNDDGIDPDSCEDVLIEDCDIRTDDDPISIKAGRDQDAWQRPGTRRVVVRNCTLQSFVGNALCIGSEMSGGVERVFFEDCRILSTPNAFNFKCNLDRGGHIRQVYIRRLAADTCRDHGLLFQMDYHGYRGGQFPPDYEDLFLQDITIKQVGKVGFQVNGVAGSPIRRVWLERITVGQVPQVADIRFVEGLRTYEVSVNGQLWRGLE